jgi:hypothetical protein
MPMKPALILDERAIRVQLLYCMAAWTGIAVGTVVSPPLTPLLPRVRMVTQ